MAARKSKKTTRSTRTQAPAPRRSPSTADELAAAQDQLAQLQGEASRDHTEAATRATEPEIAAAFPQGRPRGGGVQHGLIGDKENSLAASLTQFPDLAGRLLSTPNLIEKPSPKHRVFHSKYERHLMQVTMPLPIFDPLFGKRIDNRPKRFEFQARADLGVGEFITDNPEDILFIEGGVTTNEKGETVQVPPAMGYGTIIWDAEAKQAAEARVFVRNLKTQIVSNPKLMDLLREETQEDDFTFLEMLARPKGEGSGAGT